jgi:hypothetical protein
VVNITPWLFYSGKKAPTSLEEEDGWAPEPGCTFSKITTFYKDFYLK